MDNEIKGLKSLNKQVVEEKGYGMYVWRTADGEVLGDEDGNFMNVFCMKGNRRSIAALREAAKSYGYEDGHPEWWSGKRRINDEEYEEQRMREAMGIEPDPLNVAGARDEFGVIK